MHPNSILIELHYLPSVQYMAALLRHEQVYWEVFENYNKGTYRNRCHIGSAQGMLSLSIPLKKGKNEQQNIQEVQISYDYNWQKQHWETIRAAYGKSPFFEYYADALALFYNKPYEKLLDWNMDLTQFLLQKLKLPIPNQTSTHYEKICSDKEDWRNRISPKLHKQADDELFKAQYYGQVFEDRHGFLPNLSTLDLLFCTGPAASRIIRDSNI